MREVRVQNNMLMVMLSVRVMRETVTLSNEIIVNIQMSSTIRCYSWGIILHNNN